MRRLAVGKAYSWEYTGQREEHGEEENEEDELEF